MVSATGDSETSGPLGLMGGLLDNVRHIVGDKAGSALFRFASVQEGQRIGASYGRDQLASAVARFDGLAGQHTQILDDTPQLVRLHLEPGPRGLGTAGEGILLGLLEGLLQGIYGKRYTGRLESDPQGEGTIAELVVSNDA